MNNLFFDLKKNISQYAINLRGKKIKRKIVVIESDDWGSIRMPSLEVYRSIKNLGYQPENDPYLRYDTLASKDDLSALYEALSSVKDKNGHYAKLTANCVVANPDFDKIKASDFNEYYYEPFTTTLNNYSSHSGVFELWKEGMHSDIFIPQFHGREHLNVYQWMKGLKERDKVLHDAFRHNMISISSEATHMKYGYMEGLDYFSKQERDLKVDIIKDGLRLFNDIFGYQSRSFIANCYIWDDLVEQTLASLGVNLIQGVAKQKKTDLIPSHHHVYIKHYTGQINEFKQSYLVRNVFFEPSLIRSNSWIDECLNRINIAFRCAKPAIIGSHRINYIGAIDLSNRENNLILLRELLQMIVKKWPDVEFMSSDQLTEFYITNN